MSEMTPEPPEIVFTRWLQNLRADVAQSVEGVLQRGARPILVSSAVAGTLTPTSSPGALVGYALRNLDAANPATILIADSAHGDVFFPITLAANESIRDWFGPGGIHFSGLVITVTGNVDGALFVRGVD